MELKVQLEELRQELQTKDELLQKVGFCHAIAMRLPCCYHATLCRSTFTALAQQARSALENYSQHERAAVNSIKKQANERIHELEVMLREAQVEAREASQQVPLVFALHLGMHACMQASSHHSAGSWRRARLRWLPSALPGSTGNRQPSRI